VTIGKRDYPTQRIDREHYLFDVLVAMYRTYPRAVAAMCDEHLDPSGRLLGEIREEAFLRD
jgi:hypothetical protein